MFSSFVYKIHPTLLHAQLQYKPKQDQGIISELCGQGGEGFVFTTTWLHGLSLTHFMFLDKKLYDYYVCLVAWPCSKCNGPKFKIMCRNNRAPETFQHFVLLFSHLKKTIARIWKLFDKIKLLSHFKFLLFVSGQVQNTHKKTAVLGEIFYMTWLTGKDFHYLDRPNVVQLAAYELNAFRVTLLFLEMSYLLMSTVFNAVTIFVNISETWQQTILTINTLQPIVSLIHCKL